MVPGGPSAIYADMPEPTVEVAIIGAGPIGIELAVALKRSGVSYVQFDAGQVGQTISWFPPQTRFFSSNERIAIAGVPLMTPDQTKATREQYLAYLRGVVTQFDLPVRTYESVTDIRPGADGFTIVTDRRGAQFNTRARRVVLATGGTATPRKLGVEGEDLPHVTPWFKDPHDYFRQRVLIVGGRNSAVETALRCYHAGAHVSISYRQPQLPTQNIKYWLRPEILGLIESGKITAYLDSTVSRITPTRVRLTTPHGESEIETDFVLLAIGYNADMSLCRMAGVRLNGHCLIPEFDPVTMQTNVPGIYVAGTAVGGTQQEYHVFLENCHVHIERIVAHITGSSLQTDAPIFDQPES